MLQPKKSRSQQLDTNPNRLPNESKENYNSRVKYNDWRIAQKRNPVQKQFDKISKDQEQDPNFFTRSIRQVLSSPVHLASDIATYMDLNNADQYKSKDLKKREGLKTVNHAIDALSLLFPFEGKGITAKKGFALEKAPAVVEPIFNQLLKYLGKESVGQKVQEEVTDKVDEKITDNPKALAFGTNQEGIMKKRMNPIKKYANGTNTQGVGPNNYIQSPAEVMNDYNIMLAKIDKEVANDPRIPIAAMVGGLAQQAISFAGAGGFKKTPVTPPAANGMNNVKSDVEVEGGEMYETPQGETGEFQGPSHEQGGIPLEVGEDVEEGTKIYSDRLKVGKETLAERKEARERKIANLEKVASQPLIDAALKNATQRKMMAIQKEEAADLQFQEQVNNMQAMADTMVKAFGTSMAGLQANPMEYGHGSGMTGVTKYVGGTNYLTDPDPVNDWIYQEGDANLNGYTDMIEDYVNYTPGEDVGIPKGYFKNQGQDIPSTIDLKAPNLKQLVKNTVGETADPFSPDGTAGGMFSNFAEDFKTSNPEMFKNSIPESIGYTPNLVPEGTETMTKVNPEGTMFSRGLEKGLGAIDKMGGMPGIGDLTSLFGNYLGATAGLKNAAESRSTDITHTNVYKNAGKESQKQLDKAMSSIEGSKAQAIVKATTNTQGSKKSARNAARGVNQIRGLDWLYDTALQQNIIDISAGAAGQVADIYKTKANVSMSTDQLKGQGEYQANMANEAAKDAYYTAKGLGLKDQALGVQNMGKDLNSMKQNKLIEKLMASGYGKWTGLDSKMNATNKNKVVPGKTSENKTSTTKTENASSTLSEALKSMNIVSDNAGYVTLPNGKKVKESEILTLFSNTK